MLRSINYEKYLNTLYTLSNFVHHTRLSIKICDVVNLYCLFYKIFIYLVDTNDERWECRKMCALRSGQGW